VCEMCLTPLGAGASSGYSSSVGGAGGGGRSEAAYCGVVGGAGAAPPANYAPAGIRGPVKKALLIGISYLGQRGELKGCINDVRCLRFMLTQKFGWPESAIVLLTEEECDPARMPTKQNMIRWMEWLVQGSIAGDSLFFGYSGWC
jgi:hypothetical protein